MTDQTEEMTTLVNQYRTAVDSIKQWEDYKKLIQNRLLELSGLSDQDSLRAELVGKLQGSKTYKQIPGIEAKFSLELAFDQARVGEVAAQHLDLLGLAINRQYVPASTKTVLSILSQTTPMAEALRECTIIKPRGPYLSVTKGGDV
jgi:hypothetical protein